MNLSFTMSDVGITLDTAQRVWEAARDLLREHGVCVTHARLRRDLAGKPGLQFSGDRARISGDLFESRYPSPRARQALRRSQTPPAAKEKKAAPEGAVVSSGGYSMHVVDWRTGQVRPATVGDLAESVRVVEAFGSCGPYCVTPQDVPPLLQDVVTYKTCFESGARIRAGFYSSPRQSPFIEAMCQAMGEKFSLLLGVVSPLNISEVDLDNIYRAVDQGARYPVRLVGYGVPGIGSPARLAASAAFVMAENYGAATLAALAFPQLKVSTGVDPGGPTDFRYCNYAFGAPHTFIYQVVNACLGAALAGIDPSDGVAVSGMALMTGACLPDEQAAAEKASLAMIGAMLGARQFGSAGNLCVDDIYSLEQFVIDREIAEQAVKTMDCCRPSALMANLDAFPEEIADVLSGERFLTLPSTLEVMRAFYRPSALFEHMKLPTWQGRGSPELRQAARERIREKLAQPAFELAPDKRRELDRIYRAAEQELSGPAR